MKHKNFTRIIFGIIFIFLIIISAKGTIAIGKANSDTALSAKNSSNETLTQEDDIREWRVQNLKHRVRGDKKTKPGYVDYVVNTRVKIPVLMYHSISYEEGNPCKVPKENFESQMKFLHENGFNTITVDELYQAITTGKEVPKKSVLVTLDDGYKDNYTDGFPIMKKYNIKATIFVITSTVDNSKENLNSEEIKELQKNNIDIQSHTVDHKALNKLSYEEQYNELKNSKEYLDKLLNKNTTAIAYPYSQYNEDTMKICKELGYKVAFTTWYGFSNYNQGLYELKRLVIHPDTTLKEFKDILNDY
jgi:peptidoglycan/xylan/chitin deacetylase (PgdA/CDA1 family)